MRDLKLLARHPSLARYSLFLRVLTGASQLPRPCKLLQVLVYSPPEKAVLYRLPFVLEIGPRRSSWCVRRFQATQTSLVSSDHCRVKAHQKLWSILQRSTAAYFLQRWMRK